MENEIFLTFLLQFVYSYRCLIFEVRKNGKKRHNIVFLRIFSYFIRFQKFIF